MNAQQLFTFLKENTDLKGNEHVVKKGLLTLSEEKWGEGFQEALKQRRKRNILKEIRTKSAVSKLLDYISDLTHGTQKK